MPPPISGGGMRLNAPCGCITNLAKSNGVLEFTMGARQTNQNDSTQTDAIIFIY